MRAPRFWHAPPGPLAAALAPLGALYAVATARRVAREGAHVSVPVICIGNLSAGGTGKTPAALALIDRLAARGVPAHAVTRGHGGRARGPLRVDPARHDAAEVGDEALLLARQRADLGGARQGGGSALGRGGGGRRGGAR